MPRGGSTADSTSIFPNLIAAAIDAFWFPSMLTRKALSALIEGLRDRELSVLGVFSRMAAFTSSEALQRFGAGHFACGVSASVDAVACHA